MSGGGGRGAVIRPATLITGHYTHPAKSAQRSAMGRKWAARGRRDDTGAIRIPGKRTDGNSDLKQTVKRPRRRGSSPLSTSAPLARVKANGAGGQHHVTNAPVSRPEARVQRACLTEEHEIQAPPR